MRLTMLVTLWVIFCVKRFWLLLLIPRYVSVALAEKANARVSNKTTIDLSMNVFIVNSFPMLSCEYI